MANEEHLHILKQGVDVWNRWRIANPEIIPDLSEADLRETHLSEVDFSSVFLDNANLSYADLGKGILRMALLSEANLSNATLIGADLSQARLNYARLREADLSGAYLGEADVRNVDFSYANLSNVKLSNANLSGTNFSNANLRTADLSGAELGYAVINRAYLSGANFTNAHFNHTNLGEVELGEVKGLETIYHDGPSTIGIDTIYKSEGKIPEVFLRSAGVPDNFIIYMKSLIGAALEYYSCFISYSSQDRAFAERLYTDLQAQGVRCWYAPEDLKIGESILAGIDRGIRLHDKLLLILSEHSIHSKWVEKEVEDALDKERRAKGQTVLFPIRLDDAIMKIDRGWPTIIKRTRQIEDFRNWEENNSYEKGLSRLLKALTLTVATENIGKEQKNEG